MFAISITSIINTHNSKNTIIYKSFTRKALPKHYASQKARKQDKDP